MFVLLSPSHNSFRRHPLPHPPLLLKALSQFRISVLCCLETFSRERGGGGEISDCEDLSLCISRLEQLDSDVGRVVKRLHRKRGGWEVVKYAYAIRKSPAMITKFCVGRFWERRGITMVGAQYINRYDDCRNENSDNNITSCSLATSGFLLFYFIYL